MRNTRRVAGLTPAQRALAERVTRRREALRHDGFEEDVPDVRAGVAVLTGPVPAPQGGVAGDDDD